MSLGPVMLDLESTELSPAEKQQLLHPQVGGVILFARNYESVEQVTELVRQIHALRSPHLLVGVDQEGGRVQRFRKGFTRLPPASVYGEIWRRDNHRALDLAHKAGWLMAAECRAVGVDLSFAPVLDLGKGISGVIGDRAFHQSPQVVAELASQFIHGMKQAGMAATGKHFPGHGSVKEDSHVGHPVDQRALNDIMMEDILPFERLITAGLAGIMPAHVIYTQVDEKPAGYSEFWIKKVLRSQLGFQGVVFSDDLSMEAAGVAGEHHQRAEVALHAGCDMVLACNHPEAAAKILDYLVDYSNPASQLRLVRMHGHGESLSMVELQKQQRWQQVSAEIQALVDDPELELGV